MNMSMIEFEETAPRKKVTYFKEDELDYLISELSALRRELGYAVLDIARACGVAFKTVYNFENFEGNVNIKVFSYYLSFAFKHDESKFRMLLNNCIGEM